VKPLQTIKLPVADLLPLLQESTSPVMLNFTLLYLEMGFGRCTIEEQTSMVPNLLLNISKRTSHQQDTLLFMALSVIEKINIPMDDTERENMFAFAKNPADTNVVLNFFLDILLATPT
jgi:proteasome component ECM29